ncbi:hypothetical protein CMALT394_630001 [Carnobacterium maltaromaticum]|nr:hypothetical protein CMALT394_630001 [Carnobacterium maltaromaticum]
MGWCSSYKKEFFKWIDSELYTEDVINEIKYQVMRYGGEVTFVTKEQLDTYQNMVLLTRY